MFLIILACV